MKKITEMYDEEIVALTEEQIDMLIRVECMEQGVPLEPKVPQQELFELPKSHFGYKVTGTDFWFENRELAMKLAKLIGELRPEMRMQKYEWRTGYDVEWLENFDREVTIEEKTFYDKMQVQDREQMLVKRKTLKEEYEADKKKYDAAREKVRKVSDSIYSIYYQARKDTERVTRYKATFDEYVALAGGDKSKAQVFFDRAYKQDMPEEIYQKLFPPTHPQPTEDQK